MDDLPEYGPAFSQLTDKQKLFVLAMASDPFGYAKSWAQAAGYSDKHDRCKVTAHELQHHPNIRAAALEVARSAMTTVGPLLAAAVMLREAANPKSKQRLKAAEMIANRSGLHEVQEMHVRRTDETGEAIVEQIRALAEKLGLDPQRLLGANQPKLIEGTTNALSNDANSVTGG